MTVLLIALAALVAVPSATIAVGMIVVSIQISTRERSARHRSEDESRA